MSILSGVTSSVIKLGSSGEGVKLLQELLKVERTGTFDAKTDDAVRSFQKSAKLVVDGLVGKNTWRELLERAKFREISYIEKVILTPSTKVSGTSAVVKTWNSYGGLIDLAADLLAIDRSALISVIWVESSGKPFGPDGRPIIRFENHVFWRYWGALYPTTFDRHFRFGADKDGRPRADRKKWLGHWFRQEETGPWEEMHVSGIDVGQALEWRALEKARAFDSHSAIMSASFGLGQIVGFNAKQAGYDDLEEFLSDMSSEKMQIVAMIEFIKGSPQMVEDLRSHDFVEFARLYNGPGQPEYYGAKIKEGWTAAKKSGI